MKPLRAAAKGARDFCSWAKRQGCETTLLVDGGKKQVTASDVFDAVRARVDAGIYDQLIIYFSGHGILLAPGNECWLLSRAPDNPNEAVNLSRSIEEARNAGIPHVIFVSDACRSSVPGPPLSGVTGAAIFPNRPYGPAIAEVDVLFATRPGDPAYEVPELVAAKRWRGIFTDSLLAAVASPQPDWVESVGAGGTQLSVVTTRTLKPHLETIVPDEIADVDVKLIQQPNVRVETALPKFFATVDQPPPAVAATPRRPSRPTQTDEPRLSELGSPKRPRARRGDPLAAEIAQLERTRGRASYETHTGFTLFGVVSAKADAKTWRAQIFREGQPQPLHVRLSRASRPATASSIVFEFDGRTGTALPILPEFVGTVVVEDGRVTSVNYVPSANSWRYAMYKRSEQELEQMKAGAAVAARNGQFVVADIEAPQLARQIRQAKGIDPTMGLYAAYAYAQVGLFKDVHSVYRYMLADEPELPVPFDVVMLAGRVDPRVRGDSRNRYAPFAPMLTQGWSLLAASDPLHKPIHHRLRRHLIPSLWTTFDKRGVALARQEVLGGRAR